VRLAEARLFGSTARLLTLPLLRCPDAINEGLCLRVEIEIRTPAPLRVRDIEPQVALRRMLAVKRANMKREGSDASTRQGLQVFEAAAESNAEIRALGC